MNINIINKSGNELPSYSTAHAAGMDIRAFLGNEVIIWPGMSMLIPTGLYMELPIGYEVQIRPRSGLAFKNGITVLNSPGTIDADYRGEVGIILINHSTTHFKINNGDRIAQMVIAAHETAVFNQVEELGTTNRGDGGFGSTKIK